VHRFLFFCSTANIRFLQRLPLSFTFYPTELRMNPNYITKLLIFNLLKEKLDVLNFMLLKGHPTKLRKNRFITFHPPDL
ncbi:hypothetical protein, partial [Marseilla massiliensis]|uniref:hypothetical protein n=1 Tax=Marseilla massiliensis TaxID=1841864 RepID=UPI001961619D